MYLSTCLHVHVQWYLINLSTCTCTCIVVPNQHVYMYNVTYFLAVDETLSIIIKLHFGLSVVGGETIPNK